MTPELNAEIAKMISEAIASALGAADNGAQMEAKKEMAALREETYTARLTRAAIEGKIKAGEIAPLTAGLIEMSHATAWATLAAVEARDGKLQPTGVLGSSGVPADWPPGLSTRSKIALHSGSFFAWRTSWRANTVLVPPKTC